MRCPMRADQASSAFLMMFSVFVMYMARRLGFGTAKHIGPGFLSFWAAVFLFFLSLAVFLWSTKTAREGGQKKVWELWSGTLWTKPILVVVLLVIYILIYEHVGFILSSTLVLMALFLTTKPVRIWTDIGMAILTSFITFSIFDLWLEVQLPHSVVETFLLQMKKLIF